MRRLAALLVLFALLVAACGDDDTAADDGDGHMHASPVEWEGTPPSLSLEVLPDPVKGWNVFAAVDGMTFAPASAGLDHVAGEGHAHLYVDGAKVARLYGQSYYLGVLDPGTHEVTYELNANTHQSYAAGGERIAATVTIEVPEPMDGDMEHMHSMEPVPVSGPVPVVTLTVTEDPVSGWNLHFPATDFEWAPRAAGAVDPRWGEGHAHLYVDGRKVARPYGEWFHLRSLEPGSHEIRVTLNHNDHSDYMADGAVIEAMATVEVAGEAAPARTVEVDATGDRIVRVEADLGERIALRVTLAEAGRVHVHGYDVYVDVPASVPTDVVVDASIPGVFEVEIEDTGTQIAELTVG